MQHKLTPFDLNFIQQLAILLLPLFPSLIGWLWFIIFQLNLNSQIYFGFEIRQSRMSNFLLTFGFNSERIFWILETGNKDSFPVTKARSWMIPIRSIKIPKSCFLANRLGNPWRAFPAKKNTKRSENKKINLVWFFILKWNGNK